ncbi:MAG: hypothetical protein ACT4OV_13475 [Microthrixaceae bacterium]
MLLRTRSSGVLVLLASLGGVAALVGGYWDDAWHTDRGRDSLFAAPHLVLYAGVLVAAVAVALSARKPWSAPQKLALAGGAAVLISAPLDEAWHGAFGRDAVLWSPPHMLAVVASLMLATGVLSIATRTTGRMSGAARLLAAATVIGALQMPVLEFDSDVPQFPVWTYLPVAVAGWLLATVIIRHLLDGRWSLLAVAAIYTAIRVGVVGLLAVLDHSSSVVPPMLALALLEIAVARTVQSTALRSAVNALGAPLIWFGWLAAIGGAGTRVPAAALPAAIGASVVAALAVALLSGARLRAPVAVAAAAVLFAVAAAGLATAPAAEAHDPGQGSSGAEAVLAVERVDDTSVRVELHVDASSCGALRPKRVVARRAGVTNVGVLDTAGRCRYEGIVDADDTGRWFVYVELTAGTRAVELWAPLDDSAATSTVRRPLYEPPARPSGDVQVLAGLVIYALILGMLAFTVRSSARIGAGAVAAH